MRRASASICINLIEGGEGEYNTPLYNYMLKLVQEIK